MAITPELLAVARADAPADLIIRNARVLNVFTVAIEEAPTAIAIHAGRIAGIGDYTKARATIDARGAIVAPGFIDAHMHIESTMLPPSQFARLAVPHGTTGVVADPHEIANVLGIPGIRWMMADGDGLPLRLMWGASSCVPSCHLETSGARLEAADLAPLFDDPRVVTLAEMMNFPGAVHGDPGVLAKINLGLERRMVDGHSPGLRGHRLNAYLAAGISSDHECTTADEALEKLRKGMQIYIREGSAARNLEALLPLVNPRTFRRFCFCTDDRHPADLHNQGHIDHVVRRAIALGLDPAMAMTIASFNVAQHYARRDLGAVAPGYRADLLLIDNVRDLRARTVLFDGRIVAEGGQYLDLPKTIQPPPAAPVRLPAGLSEASFRIKAATPGKPVRVIGMDPHQLVTADLRLDVPADASGHLMADISRDILKIAVIERHTGSGNIGVGFVKGFGLQRGAIASTVGHDAHNLAVVGARESDMLVAAKALAKAGGGQCVVDNGKVVALLALPIAGLMSDQPAEHVIAEQARLLYAAHHNLGCPHHDPFMPLSFMPLPVIPLLKISDLGLVDVGRFEVVGLE